MALVRSLKAKKAKAAFFQSINDIDVFVEDTARGTEKFYTYLFGRVMEGIYRINKVFPLGNKGQVLSSCKADQSPGGRPRLYIIDGDFDLFRREKKPLMHRLLVLGRYSIENYLVDGSAIVSILDEEDLSRTENDIRVKFSYDKWRISVEKNLFKLFVLYAIANESIPEFATISFSVHGLVKNQTGELDEIKVGLRCKVVVDNLLTKLTRKELNKKIKIFYKQSQSLSADKLHFVSGKDYLIPLIFMRMRWVCNIRSDNLVIKQRLAMKCDVSDLMGAVEIAKY